MLKVNELFSGIGAQRKALERLGIEHEVVGISEIDKYAIQSYEAIFGKTRNYGDISKVDKLDYADLWTYSFPCQSISVSGKLEGFVDKNGNQTRSGLLYEVQRLLEGAKEDNTLPKYLLLENVKNLVGKKFKADFDNWLEYLDNLGYNNYWQVLNAKDYGVPQNRERVFVVSIRKDIEKDFIFPKKEILTLRLKDILEKDVDECFYLSQDKTEKLLKTLPKEIIENQKSINQTIVASRGRNPENPSDRTTGSPTEQRLEPNSQGITNTLTSVQKDNYVLEPKIENIGNIYQSGGQNGNIYSTDGVSPTLSSGQGVIGNGIGSNNAPKILEPQVLRYERNEYGKEIRKDYEQGKIHEKIGNMRDAAPRTDGISNTLTTLQKDNYVLEPKRLVVFLIQKHQAGAIWDKETISPTIDTCQGGYRQPLVTENKTNFRIRKLTPLECWRLMGFDDEDFYKAKNSGVSNTQLYKQAGNSIVVNVLETIFKNLFR